MNHTYRPEIDGLRAIAVVAVVIYHANFLIRGFPVLGGGYLGVDVFFVISGYLIGSIIMRELESDSFSFALFYERRVRRILPALFLVMLASSYYAWKTMLPKSLVEFSSSQLSALSFMSNIWFWREDSYTADASFLKPLLHTWSLSVEEQFYILFPPLILLGWRYLGRWLLPICSVLLIVSLISAQVASQSSPDAAFYLIPYRAWELLAGICLAWLEINRGRNSKGYTAELLPGVGLIAIVASLILFDDNTRHPSYLTLLPVAGTALIIWYAGTGGMVTRLLSSGPFVSIGLISYSLYLWHFPIFSFEKRANPGVEALDMVVLIALSLLLSIISYRLVERPFRNSAIVGKRALYATVFSVFIALILFSGMTITRAGFPERLGVIVGLFDNLWAKAPPGSLDCIGEQGEFVCSELNIGAGTLVAVGDSHAQALSDIKTGLPAMAKARQGSFIGLYYEGCPMIKGTHKWYAGHEDPTCHTLSGKVDVFLSNQPPLTVIYNSRLAQYFDGTRFDNKEGAVDTAIPFHATVRQEITPEPGLLGQAIADRLTAWLSYGHKLVVVYPVPEVAWDIPRLVKGKLDAVDANHKIELYESLDITTNYDVFKERTARATRILDGLGDHKNLIRIYPEEYLCSKKTARCHTHDKGGLYYADSNHLSTYGSVFLLQAIEDHLSAAAPIR